MSEYWVSTTKHFCKVCSCWIADNKQTIQNHENGVKHKMAVQANDKKRKEERLHGAHSEKELKRQLAEIENAAKASLLANRSEYGGMFYPNASITAIKPNAPPPPPSSIESGILQDHDISVGYAGTSSDSIKSLRKDDTGIYTIRNQTYLEGSIHEDKLCKGVKCEIFIEDLQGDGDWYPAKILLRKDIPVPNTTIIIRKFDVEYVRMGSNGVNLTVHSDDVRSDKLRLLANSDGSLLYEEDYEIIQKESKYEKEVPITAVDETTGIGKWTTISVKEVDEVAEEKARRKAERELAKEKKEKEDYLAEKLKTSIMNNDSALSTYDPYGTGVYKGVKIKSEDIIKHEIDSLSNGQEVKFKKRKAPTSNMAMKKEKLDE